MKKIRFCKFGMILLEIDLWELRTVMQQQKKSFIKYVGVISGFNVSKTLIEKWIKGMENDGFTKTTIGIYLRACRVVWNECTQSRFS